MTVELNQLNKRRVWDFWQALESVQADQLATVARQYMTADITWHGPAPFNHLQGMEAFVAEFWLPLQRAFPGLKRQSHIFMGGTSNGRIDGQLDGRMWVGGTGSLNGVFASDYLSIPATGNPASIRWGEFCRMEEGKIVEVYLILDFIDLMQQAGYQVLPPSRGADGIYPPPRNSDGVMLATQDEQETQKTLTLIRKFIFEGLNKYDQSQLESMGVAHFFHTDVQWYGPGGIGACLGLAEFEDRHQKPWLHAYPDRQVQNLDSLFAEGTYCASSGWAGVKATHSGQYLDCPATGNRIEFNGIDFWRREGNLFVENWVFVDMIHLFSQFGVDLFARLEAMRGLQK